MYKPPPLYPDVAVMQAICDYLQPLADQLNKDFRRATYKVDMQQVRAKGRHRYVVLARCLITHYLCQCCHWNVEGIGYWMNRDHTTIVYHRKHLTEQLTIKPPTELKEALIALSHLFASPTLGNDIDTFLREYGLTLAGLQKYKYLKRLNETNIKRKLYKARQRVKELENQLQVA